MTARVRAYGFRIPRRLQRGVVQRPHPETKRWMQKASYALWLESTGKQDNATSLMQHVFQGVFSDISRRMVDEMCIMQELHAYMRPTEIGTPLEQPRFPEPG